MLNKSMNLYEIFKKHADMKWNMKHYRRILKYIRNCNCNRNKSFEFQQNPEILTIYICIYIYPKCKRITRYSKSYDFYGGGGGVGDYNRATTALKSFFGLRPQKSSRRSLIFLSMFALSVSFGAHPCRLLGICITKSLFEHIFDGVCN